MAATAGTGSTGVERCVSCDAPLAGPYCSRCGERTIEPEALTLRHFLVHTVAQELLSVDGALWRTLRLLFVRPGQLALEYAAGRRRPYVNPFRLLLIAVVVYVMATAGSGLIVTLSFGPVTLNVMPPTIKEGRAPDDFIAEVDKYGLLRRQLAAKQGALTDARARERFNDRLAAFVEPASFANVLLFAVALHVAFRRRRRRFLEHVAFSMQFISFVLLSSLALHFARPVGEWLGPYWFLPFFLPPLWQFGYLAVAIRRFYLPTGRWGGRLLSVAAATLLYVLNTAFLTAVQLAGAAIALALA